MSHSLNTTEQQSSQKFTEREKNMLTLVESGAGFIDEALRLAMAGRSLQDWNCKLGAAATHPGRQFHPRLATFGTDADG